MARFNFFIQGIRNQVGAQSHSALNILIIKEKPPEGNELQRFREFLGGKSGRTLAVYDLCQ
jgi:hypothetical protein